MLKLNDGNVFRYILYFVVCPLILISYLIEPFISDVRIYLGTAFMTDKLGGIEAAWELKPPGNRILFYLLSKLPGEGLQYQIVMKAVVAIIAILVIWYFARQISRKWKIGFDYVFLLSFLAVFAISDYVLLETEWFCVLLMMVMIGLLLSEDYRLWVLAGFLALPLVMLKGISVLFVITVFAAIKLIERGRPNNLDYLSGLVYAGIGYGVIQFLLFPRMTEDLMIAAAISHATALNPLFRLVDFIPSLLASSLDIPLLFPGVLIFIFVTVKLLIDYRGIPAFWILVMWGSAALMAFFQGEFYYYHYFPLVIPAIITVLFYLRQPWEWKPAGFSVICVMLAIFVIFSAGWGPFIGGYRYRYFHDRETEAAAIDAQFNLSGEPRLLYLDEGDASYYFRSTSASRYLYPLPVKRDALDWRLNDTTAYQENYQDIMEYNGTYILSNDFWFFMNATPDKEKIREKMDTEYRKVHDESWQVYRKV